MAAVAGLSTFDPALTLAVGPPAALAVLMLGRPLRLQIDPPVIFAALFTLWAWMSMVWTSDPEFTRATALLWSKVLVIFIAAYDLIKSRSQLRLIATGFVIGGGFAVGKSVSESTEAMGVGGRAILGDANVNYVAYSLTTALALLVLLWVTRKRKKLSTLVLAGLAALLVAGLVISDTRAAQLGAACLVVWLLWCGVTRRHPLKLVVFAVLVSAFCLVTGISDNASLAFESGARATGDWSGRLLIWPAARHMWFENPVIGGGAGTFIVTNGFGIGAHNIILQTGTGLGLIGVGLLVGLIWTALARTGQPLILGAFLVSSAPLYLSGMWETAPAAWMALAILARAGVLGEDDPSLVKRAEGPDWMKTELGQNLIRSNTDRRLIPRGHA